MANWDLLILDPIIFVLGIGSLVVMFILEKIKGRTLLFYLEIILAWIANGILVKILAGDLEKAINLNVSDTTFILMLIFGAAIFAIVFKPLATFITGKVHSRRLWMYVAYVTTLMALIFLMFNKSGMWIGFYFAAVILVAFSMSSSSLYYLFSNEQHYYRVNGLGVGYVVALTMAFATFCGTTLTAVNTHLNTNLAYYLLLAFGMVCVGLAVALSFVKKEKGSLVASFETATISTLIHTKTSSIVLLVVMALLISAAQQLTHGLIDKMFVAFSLAHHGYSGANIVATVDSIDVLITGLTVIIGYYLYRFVMRVIGIRFYTLVCAFISVICISIQSFLSSGVWIVVLNAVTALMLSQILFTLFSIAIFQNYRRHNVPITGYVAAATQGGIFIDDLVENILIKNKVSIFAKYNTINSIIHNYDTNTYRSDYDGFNTMLTAVCCVAICITLITILIWYFRSSNLLAEFIDLKQALINQKNTYRKSMVDRAKTPVDFGN
jgi:hypothetical protein